MHSESGELVADIRPDFRRLEKRIPVPLGDEKIAEEKTRARVSPSADGKWISIFLSRLT
jgi:hypothetical protein